MSTLYYRLLRNATAVLEIGGRTFLIDPMLAAQGTMPPMPMTSNGINNPTVPLAISAEELSELLRQIDAVLVTHSHPDHWDEAAQQMLPKTVPVFCQPADAATIREAGFEQVLPVQRDMTWNGIRIMRTSGQHGHGELAQLMGPVSGYVLEADGQRIYLAGDTVWCPEVKMALTRYQPDVVVLNAGLVEHLIIMGLVLRPLRGVILRAIDVEPGFAAGKHLRESELVPVLPFR